MANPTTFRRAARTRARKPAQQSYAALQKLETELRTKLEATRAECEALRHQREEIERQKASPLASGDVVELRSFLPPDPLNIFSRWNIPEDNHDACEVARQLAKAWEPYTAGQRSLVLGAVDAIAAAERAKRKWNPKARRGVYLRLANSASAAARLADEIGIIFPPPWQGDRTPVGDLVSRLAEYVASASDVTSGRDRDVARYRAEAQCVLLKKETPKRSGRITSALLRDLVRLATGGSVDVDESTIRRYGARSRASRTRRPRSSSPVATHWKRNWSLVVRVLRQVPDHRRDLFGKVMQDLLNSRS